MSGTRHRRVSNMRPIEEGLDDSPTRIRARRKLEYKIVKEEEEAHDASCLGNAWKSVATLLLTAALLGPLLYTSYRRGLLHNHSRSRIGNQDIPEFLLKADGLTCSVALNISYSQIYIDVKSNKNPLCREPFVDQTCALCENPTVPRRRDDDQWVATFARNKELASSASKEMDVVFVGDSITEHWIGTGMGMPHMAVPDNPRLWKELEFDKHALALGISGDEIANLLYRLENDEIPQDLNPKALLLLIGTNDYNQSYCSRETVLAGNLEILVQLLQQKPTARIILSSILPRGEGLLSESTLWDDFTWINRRLECLSRGLSELYHFDFFNATPYFLTDDETEVNQTLMYDFLHPSTDGYNKWGLGIKAKLNQMGAWSTS